MPTKGEAMLRLLFEIKFQVEIDVFRFAMSEKAQAPLSKLVLNGVSLSCESLAADADDKLLVAARYAFLIDFRVVLLRDASTHRSRPSLSIFRYHDSARSSLAERCERQVQSTTQLQRITAALNSNDDKNNKDDVSQRKKVVRKNKKKRRRVNFRSTKYVFW